MSRYLRRRDEEQHASNLELFYDLVFVLAVTQISHLLLADLTWGGAGEATLVLLVVWWAWNYTTWVTNVLDPEAVPVRLLVLAIMFASLVMAVAIPGAFADRALLFAGAYVAIQIGRHAFLTFVVADRDSQEREPALHILIWFCAAGVFWIAGALAGGSAQIALWLVALAIDYSAPLFLYRVPGRPKLEPTAWDVETSHFAERFQLFVIIALGESIVVTGATTSELSLGVARLTAFGVAFLITAAFWWLYFSYVAAIAQRRLELCDRADDDGARRLHLPARRSRRGRDRVGRRRRDRDRASDGDAAHGRARRGRRRPGHLSRRPCPFPTGDGGLDEREAGRRSRRLRRRRLPRPRHSRARRRGAAPRSCSSRSSSPSTPSGPAAAATRRALAAAEARSVGATEPSAQRAG